MPLFQKQAEELISLLQTDQAEKRALGRAFFETSDKDALTAMKAKLKQKTSKRTKRMLEILHEVGEPSISNIGVEGAKAMSVLASHDGLAIQEVLTAFDDLYKKDRENCYYQAIPAMTDLWLILQRKPQRFATQWMFDANKQPFLPTVETMENINGLRAKYDVGPFRWPKSLAIPEEEQPWLKQPLSKVVMRDLTEEELGELAGEY